MYGMSQKLKDRSLVKELTAAYLDALYLTDCGTVNESSE